MQQPSGVIHLLEELRSGKGGEDIEIRPADPVRDTEIERVLKDGLVVVVHPDNEGCEEIDARLLDGGDRRAEVPAAVEAVFAHGFQVFRVRRFQADKDPLAAGAAGEIQQFPVLGEAQVALSVPVAL